MENAIEVRNVSKNYKYFKLDDISFVVPKGSIMGLVGTNGAGKSTTIKAILKLISIDSGEIKVFGEDIKALGKGVNNDIGVVFDSLYFYEKLNAKKVSNILKDLYKNWEQDIFEGYMKRFGLPMDKILKEYSRGMQMKLSISIALAHHAKLLILDEATSGLDPVVRDEILDILLDFIQDENNSILMSSHITSDLEKVADYITFIYQGRIILSENKDKLLYNYGVMKCSEEQFKKVDKRDIISCKKMDYQYNILVKNKEEMKNKYEGYVIDNSSIDDIMLLYVKGES